eukprot:Platyproteum_vivax@DN3318_c1_g1_i1.p1
MLDDEFDFQEELNAQDALKKKLQGDGVQFADVKRFKGRNSIVCRHWLKGTCMKGEQCEYLHQLDAERMPECPVQQKHGKCTDPTCFFKHTEPEEKPICARYQCGFCPNGPLCKRRHTRLPIAQMVEEFPDWFINELVEDPVLIPQMGCNFLPPVDDGRHYPPDTIMHSGNKIADMGAAELGSTIIIPGGGPMKVGAIRCFHIKSSMKRNISISQKKGIWATFPHNTHSFAQAFQKGFTILLVWSSNDTRAFCGYGTMKALPDENLYPRIWGKFSEKLGPNFQVEWLKKCAVCWQVGDLVMNPLNENRPVHAGRDCQEVDIHAAASLCQILYSSPDDTS